MPPKSKISLNLIYTIKETQLHYGLRADDFERYHDHLTHRMHNLRRQLSLHNDKRKYLGKKVTAQNATNARHILLVAYEAERAWCYAEQLHTKATTAATDAAAPSSTQPQQQQKKKAAATATATASAASNATAAKRSDPTAIMRHHRKRLHKAVNVADTLRKLCESNGDASLKLQAEAYCHEMRGRSFAASGSHAQAKAAYLQARDAYFKLLDHDAPEQELQLIVTKVLECDDRVQHYMQLNLEDPTKYRPDDPSKRLAASSAASGRAVSALSHAVNALTWLDRPIHVYNIKAKELMREAAQLLSANTDDAAAAAAVVDVDTYDRVVGLYNDAINHARHDLRDGVGDKTQNQLLTQWLLFHVHFSTYQRTRLLMDKTMKNFELTTKFLKRTGASASTAATTTAAAPSGGGGGKSGGDKFNASQYASPNEIVHLFDLAIQACNELLLLPGVEGHALGDAVEAKLALCAAGRFIFIGEGWRIVGDLPRANTCFTEAAKLLKSVKIPKDKTGGGADTNPEDDANLLSELQKLNRRAITLTRVGSYLDKKKDGGKKKHEKSGEAEEQNVATSSSSASQQKSSLVMMDNLSEFQPCGSFVKFPPDFQSLPCKPVFVDIASTYVDYAEIINPDIHQQQAKHKDPTAKPKQPQREANEREHAQHKPTREEEEEDEEYEEEHAEGEEEGGNKKGWFSGWGWSGKKK